MSEQTKQIGQAAWDAVHNHGAFRRDFPNDDYLEAVGAAVLAAVERPHASACEMCRWERGFGARRPIEHTCEKADTTVTQHTDERRPTDAPRDPYAECVCGHGRHTHVRYTGACGMCFCAAVRSVDTTDREDGSRNDA